MYQPLASGLKENTALPAGLRTDYENLTDEDKSTIEKEVLLYKKQSAEFRASVRYAKRCEVSFDNAYDKFKKEVNMKVVNQREGLYAIYLGIRNRRRQFLDFTWRDEQEVWLKFWKRCDREYKFFEENRDMLFGFINGNTVTNDLINLK